MTGRKRRERRRSPAYPNIPLEDALARLVELHSVFKDRPAALDTLGEAWSLKAPAYINRIIAALRYFGLVKYSGKSNARQIVLSETGRRYVQAHDAELKAKIIKTVALRPRNIAKFWALW